MRDVSCRVPRKSGAQNPMRILVSVKPKMYREAIALALHIHRPHTEVMLTAPESLDGRVEDFSPHLFVRTDAEGVAPEAPESVACLIDPSHIARCAGDCGKVLIEEQDPDSAEARWSS